VVAVRNPLEPPGHADPLNAPPLSTPIELIVGYEFARPELLREATTHRSAVQGKRRRRAGSSNERMEFIGDRVLGLLIAEWLAERFPREDEGDLGHRLGALVSQPVLATVAEEIGLGEALSVAANEARDGVRKRASVLADGLEAVLGALYLDGGLGPARDFVRRSWSNVIEEQRIPPKDPKSTLQEWMHARGIGEPAYIIASRAGPPHAPEFVVTVSAAGFTGTGTAGSKRAAEQSAAEDLLRALAT
jgi:ribonuclease III